MSLYDLYKQQPLEDSNETSTLSEEEKHAVTLGVLHAHCTACVNRNCTISPDGLSSCSIIECPYSCGQRFHRCKLAEHENFCMSMKVPCINHIYGCPYEILREQQARHIPVCPASVVKCMIEWNRWPMHSCDLRVKAPLPLNNPHVQCGQLDVALALRDQRALLESLSVEKLKGTEKANEKSNDTPWESNKYPPGLQKSLYHGIFSPSKDDVFCAKDPKYDDRNNYAKEHASAQLGGNGVDYISSQMGLAGLRRLSEIERERQQKLESLVMNSSPPQQEEKLEPQLPPIEVKEDGAEDDGNDEDRLINLYNKKIQLHELLGLCLNLESHSGSFTFSCDQNFRRDEIAWHFKNVHCEIQNGLNGIIEQRCPLAYQGCSFTHRRFVPLIPKGKIVHSSVLESFGLVIGEEDDNGAIVDESKEDTPRTENKDSDKIQSLREATPEIITSSKYDSIIKVIPKYRRVSAPEIPCSSVNRETLKLTRLPVEILEHIVSYLDGFSLNNLSLTCLVLRQVCASVLQLKGMVLMVWGKEENSNSWHVTKHKWIFSNGMSPIRQWKQIGHGVLNEHLKVCEFNQEKDKVIHTEEKIQVMETVDLLETTGQGEQ